MYEVVYDANTKIRMTKEQVQSFLLELQKTDVVEFEGQFLTKFFRVIARQEITEGRLHDGTQVIKKYGQWVDKHDPSVKLDVSYYPEIADDTVMSEEEYRDKLSQSSIGSSTTKELYEG